MGFAGLFSHRLLHLGWAVVSTLGLSATYLLDPYVFGVAALVGAGVSGSLFVGTALSSPRRLPLALLAALPSTAALGLLASFRWA